MAKHKVSITYKIGTGANDGTTTWSFTSENADVFTDTTMFPTLVETFEDLTQNHAPVVSGSYGTTYSRAEMVEG